MRLWYAFFCVLFLLVAIPPDIASGDPTESGDDDLYTLYGNIYDEEGNYAAKTSMKIVPRGSIWAENGTYSISDIPEGEHTVRAYFMNNGHGVVYRQIYIDSDMNLDWYPNKNWVTAKLYDESGNLFQNHSNAEVKLLQKNESATPENGRVSFGSYLIGEYYTIRSSFGVSENSTHFIHFKLESGSATEFDINDFNIVQGMNSRYGFVKDSVGNAMQGVTVSDGTQTVSTNSDGFFLLQNLSIGDSVDLTFKHGETEVAPTITEIITPGEGWLNNTATIEIILPGNASFTTQVQVIEQGEPCLIEWDGGNYTDTFSLYRNGIIAYEGTLTQYTFTPQSTGNFEFTLHSNNVNGTTIAFKSLVLMVLPEQSSSDLWAVGMHWNYTAIYSPSNDNRNLTMTAIGKELVVDAFGVERESFLVRMTGPHFEDEEKSYRWVDSKNLLYLHTYWEDDPDSSSYFQEGYLGWNFTNQLGVETNLLTAYEELNLHFNRTNIIGVPGHPNGYDDTFNSVEITPNVEITTQAGNFSTTYICIIDNNDGIKSWELWYNETVRNWVKKIDRLPGSHSDSVVMELTSYEVPITPQFVTENSNVSTKDFSIEWAPFQGASSYELTQDGNVIYSGIETSYTVQDSKDGSFSFQINAKLSENYILTGEILSIDVLHVVLPPNLVSSTDSAVEGEEVTLSWDHVEDSVWYSVTVWDSNGVSSELYNGTDLECQLTNLEPGLYRLRVAAGTSDGKYSEMSDSIFVEVTESEESSSFLKGLFQPLLIVALIAITMGGVLIFEKGD